MWLLRQIIILIAFTLLMSLMACSEDNATSPTTGENDKDITSTILSAPDNQTDHEDSRTPTDQEESTRSGSDGFERSINEDVDTPTELSITKITDNRSEYDDLKIPKYEKFEITFQIEKTVAQNFQFPYDSSPPSGIDLSDPAYQGINVDANFSPDNWQTIYQQPAFYYQFFEDSLKESWDGQEREWYSPTENNAWKVRFSPNQAGTWQYKLVAQDASGTTESQPISFEVADSTNHGFIKVSQDDNRYFNYDDGELFYPLGLQGGGQFEDPVLANEPIFQTYKENGINLKRIWISNMYGSAWLEWLGTRNIYDGYLPRPGILPFYDSVRDSYSMTQLIDYEPDGNTGWFDACRFQFWNDPEAIKPDTTYRLQVKYWGKDIAGPRDPSFSDYGLVGKIDGGWVVECYDSGTNTVVTDYGGNTSDWDTLEGTWHSGDNSFLPRIYLGLENVTQGWAYISSISLREDLGDGQYGPEILAEPSMEYELYFPEQRAYALDKVVELAEKYGLYLKLVIHEKNDKIYFKLDDDGTFVYDEEDNSDGFYGVGRETNKTRWLQQAWWRYLQARWGYSTAIHSWELTNEGDPWNGNHWALTDELGKFMHCRVFGIPVNPGDGEACEYDHPNDHLVTTSFWHSFPGEQFWASPDYPNVDYADVHAYVSTGWLEDPAYETDTALFHLDYSSELRSNIDFFADQNGIPSKPVIRGETGIDFLGEQRENPDLALDSNGVWLHNLIWAGLDPGAMTELYWWRENIDGQPGPDGKTGLYEIFSYFHEFIQNIPLSNGHYQDAEATLSDSRMRVTGQKDTNNGRAHLWIQNVDHTWRNEVDGIDDISGLSGTVTIAGFAANKNFDIEWHEFNSQGIPTIEYSSTTSDEIGTIVLDLPADPQITDVGIKIGDY